jgi:hypothetical protein
MNSSFKMLTVLLFVSFCQLTLPATEHVPFRLELEDQFRIRHSLQADGKRPVLLVSADRDGSNFIEEWIRPLTLELIDREVFDQIQIVSTAELAGVPPFVRGIVRNAFPKDESMKILMDWQGVVGRSWPTTDRHCNLILFDANGQWLETIPVRSFEQQQFERVLARILSLIE